MSVPLNQEQKIIHFLNRTSFGPTREEVQKVNRLGIRAYLDEQLSPERIPDSLVEEKLVRLKTMRLSTRELVELYPAAQSGSAAANDAAAAVARAPASLFWSCSRRGFYAPYTASASSTR
jgi:hypothetical protein